MEIPDQDMVQLQAFRPVKSMKLNTGTSFYPGQKQRDDSEPDIRPASNHGTPEPRDAPSVLALIERRIQQLEGRRFLLLKMRFRNRADSDIGGTTEEITGEDNASELDAIQKELEELMVKKEELERLGKRSKLGQQDVCPIFTKTEITRGGIYLLPPPQLTQEEDITPEWRAKTRPAAKVVPVDSLGSMPDFTKCPSCQEVVLTQTQSKVGQTSWMLCCMCSLMGCLGGCCLLPFCLNQLKDIHHQCPRCQAHIHTRQPI